MAERHLACARRAVVHAGCALEEGTLRIHQRDQRHRGAEHLCRERGEPVEALLRRRLEKLRPRQRRQARGIIGRKVVVELKREHEQSIDWRRGD